MPGVRAVLALGVLGLAGAAAAEGKPNCATPETTGWHFYCDPAPEEAPAPPPEETAAPAPEATPEAPPPMTATEEMMAFRARVEELKHRAVLYPTEENVRAYMEINAEMAARAGTFADVWQRVLFRTPALDANTRRPLVQRGAQIYDVMRDAEREATLRRVAAEEGLLFVFEDPARCPLCAAQAEVLEGLNRRYGVEVLAISADGAAMPGFPGARTDTGQLAAMGIADLPRPLIALVNPGTDSVELIGAGLLAGDQILERVHVVRAVPVGAGFRRGPP
jgi:conjugal transfer pilus assembly protein TraF